MIEFVKAFVTTILTLEAQIILKRKKPKIIAITGSVGKTSTKDAIYTILKNRVHARKSDKSFNSDIGIVLTVLGLSNGWHNPFIWAKNILDGALTAFFSSSYPEVLVLEMGVDRPGDMRRLTRWIKPDVVVLTRFPDVPVHVEFFADPEDVVKEKMTLTQALRPDGVLIYNNNDKEICSFIEEIPQQAFSFGRTNPSHFMASGDRVIYDGSLPAGIEFVLTHINTSAKVQLYDTLGTQHGYTYAAAVAVASLFDISLDESVEILKGHTPPRGRMCIIPGIKGSVIIDDSNSSSPVACAQALQTLLELQTKSKKIVVLGDMLELGKFSVREHERIGELLANKVDALCTLGVRSRKIAEGALANGMNKNAIFQYDEISQLLHDLPAIIENGDVVLVKGSQNMRTEKIVEAIMEHREKAGELLVRQSPFWKKK
jgi:UDP-N-acetylmuramyl pentapeptide synthase